MDQRLGSRSSRLKLRAQLRALHQLCFLLRPQLLVALQDIYLSKMPLLHTLTGEGNTLDAQMPCQTYNNIRCVCDALFRHVKVSDNNKHVSSHSFWPSYVPSPTLNVTVHSILEEGGLRKGGGGNDVYVSKLKQLTHTYTLLHNNRSRAVWHSIHTTISTHPVDIRPDASDSKPSSD